MTAAHDRISKMFNMGDYGRKLAQELLDDHVREITALRLDEALQPLGTNPDPPGCPCYMCGGVGSGCEA